MRCSKTIICLCLISVLLFMLGCDNPVAPRDAWNLVTSGTTRDLYSITWTGTQFVAVGNVVLTSPDGTVWTKQDSVLHSVYSVTWTGTQLVAVGGNAIYTSQDGVKWAVKDTGNYALKSVIWTGTQLVAVGYGGDIKTSSDGQKWQAQISGTTK